MSQELREFKQIGFFSLVGFCLLGVAYLTPNATDQAGWEFFRTAKMSTWRHLYDWPAAWCSLKIVVFSLGLFLVIDAMGTLLALIRLKTLALSVFFMHALPGVGILAGGYYLLKALL